MILLIQSHNIEEMLNIIRSEKKKVSSAIKDTADRQEKNRIHIYRGGKNEGVDSRACSNRIY